MSICQKTEDGYKILASSNGNVINGAELEHYSNEERIVGYWTDGKPIYRKVVTFTATQKGAQKTVSLSTLGITNVDKMVRQQGIINTSPIPKYYGASDGWNVNFGVDTSMISYNIGEYWTVPIQMSACLEYTKTTDTPVANNNTYSTDEIITGKTWIDGKPIYRKVVTTSFPNVATDKTMVSKSVNLSELGISNIDTPLTLQAIYANGSSLYVKSPTTIPSIYSIGDYVIDISFSKTELILNSNAQSYNGRTATCILEYTKTTD